MFGVDESTLSLRLIPRMQPLRFSSLTICFALLLGAFSVQAQDEFTIDGVDDPASAAAGSGSDADSGSESDSGGDGDESSNVFLNFIEKGGTFIWPLIILSMVLVGLIAYCFIDLNKRNFYPEKIISGLNDDMTRADLAHALDRAKHSPTCVGQVMYGAIEYVGDRGYQVLDDNGLYDSMADASQEFNRGRARTINYLSVIAQAAPMLGLLGTVSGMIKAFGKLSSDSMNPSQLAGDISEALLTTASGLVIALPALFFYFFFRDMLTGFVSRTDRHAFRLLNTLRRSIVAQSAAAAGGPTPTAPGDADKA